MNKNKELLPSKDYFNKLFQNVLKDKKQNYNQILEMYGNVLENLQERDVCPLAITLDWLSIYFNGIVIPDGLEAGECLSLDEDCYLVKLDGRTLHFNSRFKIIYKSQECGTLLTHSNNEKFFKSDVIKVDFTNHTLYSGVWEEMYSVLENYGFKYKSAARIDIAIDGVNYLHSLLNTYAKQTLKNKIVALKNSSENRARFSAKVLNTNTFNFENFNIGNGGNYKGNNKSSGSNKMITVYNKSLELVRSGKQYILDWWVKNGIIEKVINLEEMAKKLEALENKNKEAYDIKGMQNVYRFEIRLKSQAIKGIKGFNIDMLKNGKGLASIVKLHCDKFFEAYFVNDTNVSRCKKIELLPYERLGAVKIQKVKREDADGLYKAKLTLHSAFYDMYTGKADNDKTSQLIEVIKDKCHQYRLYNYLNKKIEEWDGRYRLAINKDRITSVITFRDKVQNWVNEYTTEDIQYIRITHNQAAATASFGEM